MKRRLASLFVLLLLIAPAALFAQETGGEAPPPETPPAETPPPETPPAETPPPEAPAETPPAETPPAETPVEAPAPTPTPTETASAPAEPRPEPVTPSIIPAVQAATSTPEPEAEPIAFEDVQDVLENVAMVAPDAFQPWIAALIGALGGAALMFGGMTAMRANRRKKPGPCACCGGTGRQGICPTCKGTKIVEEEVEPTLVCPKCLTEGEVDCARCEGKGVTEVMSCSACKGEGTVDCDACLGVGEADVALKKKGQCPDCT